MAYLWLPALAWLPATAAQAELSYAEGGPATEDPCPGGKCFYIDSMGGRDSWDGSKSRPWKTLGKAASSKARFGPGTHILFKRGGHYPGTFTLDGLRGEEGNRIVIGAYGPLAAPMPRLPGVPEINTHSTFVAKNEASYLTIRDLHSNRIVITKSHHILVYNNKVEQGVNNNIHFGEGTHHVAIVSNWVGSVESNDGISIHDSGGRGNFRHIGSHFWVVDNTVKGNEQMEEPFDLATSGPAGDFKIVGNRFLPIKSNTPFIIGYNAHHTWVVGNVMKTGRNNGVMFGFSQMWKYKHAPEQLPDFEGLVDYFPYLQMTGNVVWGKAAKTRPLIRFDNLQNGLIQHNTALATDEPARQGMVIKNELGTTRDNVVSKNLTRRPTGLSLPQDDGDPTQWKGEFLNAFVPPSTWSGCGDFGETPGAFTCDGEWQGLVLKPFEGYEEGEGLGWPGPAIVQEKLRELGIRYGDELSVSEPSTSVLLVSAGLVMVIARRSRSAGRPQRSRCSGSHHRQNQGLVTLQPSAEKA